MRPRTSVHATNFARLVVRGAREGILRAGLAPRCRASTCVGGSAQTPVQCSTEPRMPASSGRFTRRENPLARWGVFDGRGPIIGATPGENRPPLPGVCRSASAWSSPPAAPSRRGVGALDSWRDSECNGSGPEPLLFNGWIGGNGPVWAYSMSSWRPDRSRRRESARVTLCAGQMCVIMIGYANATGHG
jgi:hypothetical protein